VLAEDRIGKFAFSPLQGEAFKRAVAENVRKTLPDSFVVIDESGQTLLQSDAVIHIAARLGGFWRALGAAVALVPKSVRDRAYRFVGAIRHRLFVQPNTYCPTVPTKLRVRFIG